MLNMRVFCLYTLCKSYIYECMMLFESFCDIRIFVRRKYVKVYRLRRLNRCDLLSIAHEKSFRFPDECVSIYIYTQEEAYSSNILNLSIMFYQSHFVVYSIWGNVIVCRKTISPKCIQRWTHRDQWTKRNKKIKQHSGFKGINLQKELCAFYYFTLC